MPRKRMLEPQFFLSKPMNELPIATMVTFAGIWCWADDFGRGEDDAALVKAAVWARRKTMTEKHVRAAMDALVGKEVLCRYVVAGAELIHVTHWREHQKISHPTASKLAPCPIHETAEYELFAFANGFAPETFANSSGVNPERLHDSVVKSSSGQISSSSPSVTRGAANG